MKNSPIAFLAYVSCSIMALSLSVSLQGQTALPSVAPATAPEGVTLSPTEQRGLELFNTTGICFTCHTIGRGRLIGPDLANMHERRENDWLVSFIKSSQTLVKNGDAEAVKLFNEYNMIPMPDALALSDTDIQAVIDFIKVASKALAVDPADTEATAEDQAAAEPASAAEPAVAGSTVVESKTVEPAPEGDSAIGEKLFVGLIRLENKGPSCNSCHHVNADNVIAGGSLAKDLTREYSTLGGGAAGMVAIEAFLAGAPFPAMTEAYGDKPLTREEIVNLAAFLRQIDQTHEDHKVKNYGQTLLFSGILGAAVLMGVFPILWRKRKRGSVNQELFERQISSDN